MTKITADGNGMYHVPAKLANGLLLTILGTMLTVIVSIILWWYGEGAVKADTTRRLIVMEQAHLTGQHPVADRRISVVESQMVNIGTVLVRMDSRLARIETKLNGE